MQVEECCQALLEQILPEVDPGRAGLAIDIGVGTFAFYCKLFAQLKFRTIAVEPLPIKPLRKLCSEHKIRLIESCISDIDGFVNIYIGSYNGEENLNLNSMRADWWGSTATAKKVRSMSLTNLCTDIDAHKITCMKIDVEGMEVSIIQQLINLSDTLLPKVLMFEYGGGDTSESQQGGWSKELLDGTIKSLKILRDLGYEQTIVVDGASNTKEQNLDLRTIILEPNKIFPPQSIYGNIIAIRGCGFQYHESRIASICQLYYENQLISPTVEVPKSLLRRTAQKILQIIYK